jgi:phage shock protein PspC (stress-responsive transcriptional regulator)
MNENTSTTRPMAGELRRSADDKMLAGVAGGLARYLGVDSTLVRLAFAVLSVIGGAGIPLYIACWLLIPEDGARQSVAADFIESHRSR